MLMDFSGENFPNARSEVSPWGLLHAGVEGHHWALQKPLLGPRIRGAADRWPPGSYVFDGFLE